MEPRFRWIWLLIFIFTWISQTACKELRVVCYYTNWSVYRPGTAKFSPQNINPYLCTHLIYAFGGFTKENTLKPFDKYQDIEKGGYAKFTGLKTYNKNLKTMLAIGGWNEGSSRFSPMVASAERRKELVKNVVKFLRQNHFDGLDLDWEYPSFRDGGKTRDRDNYAQLVQELREEFERETSKTGRTRLLLTMAVPAGIEYINKGYDVPKLMKYLDWMNILSYDYHSAFEPSVNHHAPLYPLEEESEYNYDTELNIDHTIKHYLEAGAISSKLVLGIPTYGRSYTLFNPDSYDIGAPADGPGDMGDATRENGYLAYYEICESVKSGDWTVVQPNDDAMGPYAYKDNQWVGYDDEAIVRKKAQYVAEKDLGGIMFWAIDNDDFRGTCHNKPYPLIEAAKEALIEALGLTEENAIQTQSKTVKNRGRTRGKITQKVIDANLKEKSQNADKPTRRRPINRVTTEKPEPTKTSRRRRPVVKKVESNDDDSYQESGSSLVVTPGYLTPEPPTTPGTGGDFKCEDEGFYPHPRDCKKYFWCLNGPSELGIIAHQFTCPAGLYFNKAASSCDYTQNVLCNKKLTKPVTTTPASATLQSSKTTESPDDDDDEDDDEVTRKSVFNFSTRRPAPKITAATSRTTYQSTTSTSTTTAAPEYEEYEIDDDEISEDTDAEDPKVIKELLDLIRKAGGIEELEKALNIKDDTTSSAGPGSTTPSSLNKKIFAKVLARTKLGDATTKKSAYKYNAFNRNSRGPQNEGISKEEKQQAGIANSRSARPQYSTISRQRATKQKSEDAEDDEDTEVDEVVSEDKPKVTEYKTLRRIRPSTTSKPAEDVDDEIEDEDTKNDSEKRSTTTSRSPYVTIRRSRPTTVSSTTTDDSSLNRKVLGEDEDNEEDVADNINASPNYVVIQRNRPSTEASSGTSSKYKEIRRSTTSAPITEDELATITLPETSPTIAALETSSLTKVPQTFLINTTEDAAAISSLITESLSNELITTAATTQDTVEIQPPQLLEPRPFSFNTNVRSSTTSATTKNVVISTTSAPISKVITRKPLSRYRPNFRRGTTTAKTSLTTPATITSHRTRNNNAFSRPSRRRFTTAATASSTTTVQPTIESRDGTTKSAIRRDNRFRVATRKHYLASTTTSTTTQNPTTIKELKDQTIESSNQQSLEENINETDGGDTTELTDLALALHDLQQAPIRATLQPTHESTNKLIPTTSTNRFNAVGLQRTSKTFLNSYEGSTQSYLNGLEAVTKVPFIQHRRTTNTTPLPTTTKLVLRRHRPTSAPQAFDKIAPAAIAYTYKPIGEYDYYDDGETRFVGSIPEHSKVLIHSTGVIQCLDQGNFPHPVSCKKFISCAKMETGNVLGWEYTCPKNLSFDPVGGMCNWSAGLGCNE